MTAKYRIVFNPRSAFVDASSHYVEEFKDGEWQSLYGCYSIEEARAAIHKTIIPDPDVEEYDVRGERLLS